MLADPMQAHIERGVAAPAVPATCDGLLHGAWSGIAHPALTTCRSELDAAVALDTLDASDRRGRTATVQTRACRRRGGRGRRGGHRIADWRHTKGPPGASGAHALLNGGALALMTARCSCAAAVSATGAPGSRLATGCDGGRLPGGISSFAEAWECSDDRGLRTASTVPAQIIRRALAMRPDSSRDGSSPAPLRPVTVRLDPGRALAVLAASTRAPAPPGPRCLQDPECAELRVVIDDTDVISVDLTSQRVSSSSAGATSAVPRAGARSKRDLDARRCPGERAVQWRPREGVGPSVGLFGGIR